MRPGPIDGDDTSVFSAGVFGRLIVFFFFLSTIFDGASIGKNEKKLKRLLRTTCEPSSHHRSGIAMRGACKTRVLYCFIAVCTGARVTRTVARTRRRRSQTRRKFIYIPRRVRAVNFFFFPTIIIIVCLLCIIIFFFFFRGPVAVKPSRPPVYARALIVTYRFRTAGDGVRPPPQKTRYCVVLLTTARPRAGLRVGQPEHMTRAPRES